LSGDEAKASAILVKQTEACSKTYKHCKLHWMQKKVEGGELAATLI
jgi:hypothetical protein